MNARDIAHRAADLVGGERSLQHADSLEGCFVNDADIQVVRPPIICRPGVELLPDGAERGLDPRYLTSAELEALGHTAMSPTKALRLRCLDCCCGQTAEVRACTTLDCPAWPFRMGRNPWREPPSEERLEALREQGRARHRNIIAGPRYPAPGAEEIERTKGSATLIADDHSHEKSPAKDGGL